jgi:hypothetical protein
MASPITPFSISAPGFYGLNTSDSPVDLSANFALEANNCVIDKAGRIASRKGWTKVNTSTNAQLSTSNIECIGELIGNDGTSTILMAGGGYLLKLSGTSLVTLTYGGGGVAPTITTNNWQMVQLNNHALFFQRGYDPLIYDPSTSTTTFRRVSEHASYAGSLPQCNTAISAYGRIWAADTTTDKQTITFSDLLLPYKYTGGTSGTLNLVGVWSVGGDEVVALAAHNNFLFVFGRRQILIYTGASTPSTMTLQDTIVGIGCIARDSVQVTGDDIIFLANDGVRSIMRTIQEKSAPTRTVSRNVNHDIIDLIAAENLDNVKSCYSSSNTFYVITFPATFISYCFDTRIPLDTGGYRTTTWQSINPKAFCEAKDGTVYIGEAGYLATYSGYTDNGAAYRMSYFTTWIDFGTPIRQSILKKAILTLIGLSNQTIVFKWAYDYVQNYFSETTTLTGISTPAEYSVGEYGIAEYSGGDVTVRTVPVNGSSAGKVLQFGLEAQVNGYQISIQRIDLYTKDGRFPS